MARLESILYRPHREVISGHVVTWSPDPIVKSVEELPQIFWSDGRPWNEVNFWAVDCARNGDIKLKTIRGQMEHLHKYACWLEEQCVDWRHFPKSKPSRVLVRYRGALIESRDRNEIKPSTTTARMRAVIRFYRFCGLRNLISPDAPLWKNRLAVVRYYDSVGFERTLARLSTDLSIPNRARPGATLEDGLLPLSSEHMQELLKFARDNASWELYLMLVMGFFTGARVGTIASLRNASLEEAVPDPCQPGLWLIAVGPGTGVATKFDVTGDLLIPDQVLGLLKKYVSSERHLSRVVKAAREDKTLVFLTRFGKRFSAPSVDREMVELRRNGLSAGLKYCQKFKFHQSRATFGTWLMKLALSVSTSKSAIEFVKRAMHHRNEETTFRYVKFLEDSKAKCEVANAFTESFLGLSKRLSDEGRASDS